jgi:hypothetical protein
MWRKNMCDLCGNYPKYPRWLDPRANGLCYSCARNSGLFDAPGEDGGEPYDLVGEAEKWARNHKPPEQPPWEGPITRR